MKTIKKETIEKVIRLWRFVDTHRNFVGDFCKKNGISYGIVTAMADYGLIQKTGRGVYVSVGSEPQPIQARRILEKYYQRNKPECNKEKDKKSYLSPVSDQELYSELINRGYYGEMNKKLLNI
jgi:hypothetical protein